MEIAGLRRAFEQGDPGIPAAVQYPRAVTTGQCGGLSAAGTWPNPVLDSRYSYGRLGNTYLPSPCSNPAGCPGSAAIMVPIVYATQAQIPIFASQPAPAALADSLLGSQLPLQSKVVSDGFAQTLSGSGNSTADRLHQASSREVSESGSHQHVSEDRADSGMDDGQADSLAEDGGLRRSSRHGRQGRGAHRGAQEPKKVGRPIVYNGDPDAPELTDAERRRIKRRIANRESARRVRNKRHELLGGLVAQMEAMQAQNMQLRQHAYELSAQKAAVVAGIVELEAKLKEACAEQTGLQKEIATLRKNLQMRMSELEDELDRRVVESDASPHAQEATMVPADVKECPQEQQTAFAGGPFSCSQYAMERKPSQDAKAISLETYPSLELGYFQGPRQDSRQSLDAKMAMELFPSLNLDEGHPHLPRVDSLDMGLLNGICMFQSEEPGYVTGQAR